MKMNVYFVALVVGGLFSQWAGAEEPADTILRTARAKIERGFEFAKVTHAFENPFQVTPEEIEATKKIINKKCEQLVLDRLQQNPDTKMVFDLNEETRIPSGESRSRKMIYRGQGEYREWGYRTYDEVTIYRTTVRLEINSCGAICLGRDFEFNGKTNHVTTSCVSGPVAQPKTKLETKKIGKGETNVRDGEWTRVEADMTARSAN